MDDMFDEEESAHRGSASSWNSVNMYLRNASNTKLLSRDEEKAWFQIIDASSERMFALFSRYPFAAEMYIRELEHLASGRQHFDSIVSENSGMSCAAYKKSIPECRKSISDAVDTLVGASALCLAMHGKCVGESDDVQDESASLLTSARDEVARRLRQLSFRQSVVEDLCDIAYEDIYLPCKDRNDRNSRKNAKDDRERSEAALNLLGMTVGEFIESFAEVRSMLDIIQNARCRIAEANLRLVVHVAKKYVNRGIEMSDLLQDGSIGLMNAIRKFDLSRGLKFSTFAIWWIRQAISRALANGSRTIRIPSHKIDQLNRLDRAERDLSQSLRRPPTDAEVSKKMGISCEDVKQLHDIRQQTTSLDGAVGDDGEASLVDIIGDERCADPAEGTEKSIMSDKVREALSVLTEREKIVIDLRFGLSDGTVKTLEEIGRIFNVTREHIRQLEIEALSKLRNSDAMSALAELVA